MIAILMSLMLSHHADGSAWGWHMSCARFRQRAQEIHMDHNLDLRSRLNLVAYLRSKVEEDCDGITI